MDSDLRNPRVVKSPRALSEILIVRNFQDTIKAETSAFKRTFDQFRGPLLPKSTSTIPSRALHPFRSPQLFLNLRKRLVKKITHGLRRPSAFYNPNNKRK